MEQPVENWLATSNSLLREAVLEFLGLSTERAEANANEVAEEDEVSHRVGPGAMSGL